MKYIFFWILAVYTLNACTETGRPAIKRKAEFYVRYLAPEGQLLAEATVKEQQPGKAGMQAIEIPGGIRYRDVLMPAVRLQGSSYQMEQSAGYSSTHIFTWKDEQNSNCTFELELPAITAFSFDSAPLSRQKPASLRWEGAPLQQGESLVFMWENAAEQSTVPMEVSGSGGMDRIDFPAAQLSKLTPGEWTLYLVRRKSAKTEVNGFAVKGLAEYFTRVDTIQVK